MYAILGITGNVGGAVATQLLKAGEKVRAIVRNAEKAAVWKERGAEIAIADLESVEPLAKAFEDATGVFAMIPPNFAPEPGFPDTVSKVEVLRTALEIAKPKKLVYLSSIGAQQTSGLGLITSSHLFEEAMGRLPMAQAALRAGWFMENAAGDVQSARVQGEVLSHLAPLDRKFSLVATEDIGSVGAKVLLEDWTGKRFIEVAGPREYSPLDIAAAFSKALGKEVKAIAVPREKWTAHFESQGMPVGRTEPRAVMVDGFNSGWISFHVSGTEHVKGKVELETVIAKLVRG